MERTRQTATRVNMIRPRQTDEPASDRRSLAAMGGNRSRRGTEAAIGDVGVVDGSMSGKGGAVNTGGPSGQDTGRCLTGVRAAIVVLKRSNVRGAKGGRKVERPRP